MREFTARNEWMAAGCKQQVTNNVCVWEFTQMQERAQKEAKQTNNNNNLHKRESIPIENRDSKYCRETTSIVTVLSL